MGRMFNPPHPASIVREDVLPELGLTVTEAARQLGISRVQLSRVLNERAGISPDLAMRLEQWLGGPSAESWLHMQADYDLWQAEQKGRPNIDPVKQAA
jgi:antitoxin HigA-1